MIQVITEIDDRIRAQVQRFLCLLPADRGVCGEHDPRWLNVLHEGLGHQPIGLAARRDGDIVGWLPLARVTSRLFGRYLVSLPYLNRAGIVAEDGGVTSRLLDAAIDLARRRGVRYLELRHHDNALDHHRLTHSNTDKVRMVLDLPDGEDGLWSDIGSKVRNQVRKGDQHELKVRWGGEELVDDFYAVFAVNMRDLGTPVYPRKLFASILNRFAGEAELAVVYYENIAVAGALLVHMRGETQVPSASSLRQFNTTCANMWMYNRLLCRAIARGSTAFDFGRSSPDSGTFRFKKQWGAQPRPTTWQYHLLRGELDAMRPTHPKHQRRIATWQRLPVWVTRVVGPAIVRGIP